MSNHAHNYSIQLAEYKPDFHRLKGDIQTEQNKQLFLYILLSLSSQTPSNVQSNVVPSFLSHFIHLGWITTHRRIYISEICLQQSINMTKTNIHLHTNSSVSPLENPNIFLEISSPLLKKPQLHEYWSDRSDFRAHEFSIKKRTRLVTKTVTIYASNILRANMSRIPATTPQFLQ